MTNEGWQRCGVTQGTGVCGRGLSRNQGMRPASSCPRLHASVRAHGLHGHHTPHIVHMPYDNESTTSTSPNHNRPHALIRQPPPHTLNPMNSSPHSGRLPPAQAAEVTAQASHLPARAGSASSAGPGSPPGAKLHMRVQRTSRPINRCAFDKIAGEHRSGMGPASLLTLEWRYTYCTLLAHTPRAAASIAAP